MFLLNKVFIKVLHFPVFPVHLCVSINNIIAHLFFCLFIYDRMAVKDVVHFSKPMLASLLTFFFQFWLNLFQQ